MGKITPQTLAKIPLFSHMDDRERSDLLALMTERHFPAGQAAVKAENPEAAFHIIEQGEAEIWLTDTEGRKVVLDILGPGEFFGELSILSGDTRSASATSAEELITLELTREEFFDFLRQYPHAALDTITELAERLRHTDELLKSRVSRNANEAHDEQTSVGQHIADLIATFSGSILFLVLNALAFTLWILLNTTGPLLWHFDPYPFQFLTMAVSLEAIFLSIFVLVSQNRQSAKDRLKADLDYQVNVKTEMGMSVLLVQVRDLQRQINHLHDTLAVPQQDPSKIS
jgi:uncharacterized membrane protein